jgi:2,5-diketo-D-gluconate reductase B
MTQTIRTALLTMPKLGFGTWKLNRDGCEAAVESALALGYRHIDTAEMYRNEAEIGRVVAASGLRAELFITTKVWPDHLEPQALRQAFEQSLEKLQTDYVDLYLIHWPKQGMFLRDTLEAMMALKASGRARAIGVSNFDLRLLRKAVEEIGAPIACNQIEYNALKTAPAMVDYAQARGIAIAAYCPLAKGALIDNPVIRKIAAKHGVSAAQVGLKWLLDQELVAAIPKSARPAGQRDNLGAWEVSLDDEDRAAIAALA